MYAALLLGLGLSEIKNTDSPDLCSSVGWMLSLKVKGQEFDSRSRHMRGW